MTNIIAALEAERMKRVVPDFGPGDTVVVEVKVKEGDRERVQAYEGVVIAKSNRPQLVVHGTQILAKAWSVFRPVALGAITVAPWPFAAHKLYYLRERTGKSASKKV
jgi:large subunit ribosomal protein L19